MAGRNPSRAHPSFSPSKLGAFYKRDKCKRFLWASSRGKFTFALDGSSEEDVSVGGAIMQRGNEFEAMVFAFLQSSLGPAAMECKTPRNKPLRPIVDYLRQVSNPSFWAGNSMKKVVYHAIKFAPFSGPSSGSSAVWTPPAQVSFGTGEMDFLVAELLGTDNETEDAAPSTSASKRPHVRLTVADTKSSSHAKPEHVIQIACYALALEWEVDNLTGTGYLPLKINPVGEVWLPCGSANTPSGVDDMDIGSGVGVGGGVGAGTGTGTGARAGQPYTVVPVPLDIAKEQVKDLCADVLQPLAVQDVEETVEWRLGPHCAGCPNKSTCEAGAVTTVQIGYSKVTQWDLRSLPFPASMLEALSQMWRDATEGLRAIQREVPGAVVPSGLDGPMPMDVESFMLELRREGILGQWLQYAQMNDEGRISYFRNADMTACVARHTHHFTVRKSTHALWERWMGSKLELQGKHNPEVPSVFQSRLEDYATCAGRYSVDISNDCDVEKTGIFLAMLPDPSMVQPLPLGWSMLIVKNKDCNEQLSTTRKDSSTFLALRQRWEQQGSRSRSAAAAGSPPLQHTWDPSHTQTAVAELVMELMQQLQEARDATGRVYVADAQQQALLRSALLYCASLGDGSSSSPLVNILSQTACALLRALSGDDPALMALTVNTDTDAVIGEAVEDDDSRAVGAAGGAGAALPVPPPTVRGQVGSSTTASKGTIRGRPAAVGVSAVTALLPAISTCMAVPCLGTLTFLDCVQYLGRVYGALRLDEKSITFMRRVPGVFAPDDRSLSDPVPFYQRAELYLAHPDFAPMVYAEAGPETAYLVRKYPASEYKPAARAARQAASLAAARGGTPPRGTVAAPVPGRAASIAPLPLTFDWAWQAWLTGQNTEGFYTANAGRDELRYICDAMNMSLRSVRNRAHKWLAGVVFPIQVPPQLAVSVPQSLPPAVPTVHLDRLKLLHWLEQISGARKLQDERMNGKNIIILRSYQYDEEGRMYNSSQRLYDTRQGPKWLSCFEVVDGLDIAKNALLRDQDKERDEEKAKAEASERAAVSATSGAGAGAGAGATTPARPSRAAGTAANTPPPPMNINDSPDRYLPPIRGAGGFSSPLRESTGRAAFAPALAFQYNWCLTPIYPRIRDPGEPRFVFEDCYTGPPERASFRDLAGGQHTMAQNKYTKQAVRFSRIAHLFFPPRERCDPRINPPRLYLDCSSPDQDIRQMLDTMVPLEDGNLYILFQRYCEFNAPKVQAALDSLTPTTMSQQPLLRWLVPGAVFSKPADDWMATTKRVVDSVKKSLTEAHNLDSPYKVNLHPSQMTGMAEVIRSPFPVLWGPPGTGKTHTLAVGLLRWIRAHSIDGLSQCREYNKHDIVKQARDRTLNILVTAVSGTAIAELRKRMELILGMDQKRAEAYDQVTQWKNRVKLHVLDSNLKKGAEVIRREVKGLMNPYRTPEAWVRAGVDEQPSVAWPAEGQVQNHVIVFGTVYQLCKLENLKQRFDLLVVDEASQMLLTDLSLVLPLLHKDGRVVTAGDHMQLPPVMHGDYHELKLNLPVHRSVLEVSATLRAAYGIWLERGADPNLTVDHCLDILAHMPRPADAPSHGALAFYVDAGGQGRVPMLRENGRTNAEINEVLQLTYGPAYRCLNRSQRLTYKGGREAAVAALGGAPLLPWVDALLSATDGKDRKGAVVGVCLRFADAALFAAQLSRGTGSGEARLPMHIMQEDAIETESALIAETVRQLMLCAAVRKGSASQETVFPPGRIKVVTPHNIQKAAARADIMQICASATEAVASSGVASAQDSMGQLISQVDTVERHQGGEAEAVIIALGSNTDPARIEGEASFLYQRERLNVAVSRAKAAVVVFYTDALIRPPLAAVMGPDEADGLAYLHGVVGHARRRGQDFTATVPVLWRPGQPLACTVQPSTVPLSPATSPGSYMSSLPPSLAGSAGGAGAAGVGVSPPSEGMMEDGYPEAQTTMPDDEMTDTLASDFSEGLHVSQ